MDESEAVEGPDQTQVGVDVEAEAEGDEEEQDSPFLILDVEEPQSRARIDALRDGEGPLADSLFEVLEGLYAQGYVGEQVQPVIFVVREGGSSSDSEEE